MERVENSFTPFLLKILLLYLLVFIGYTRKDKSVESWFKSFSETVDMEVDSSKIASSQEIEVVFDEAEDDKAKKSENSPF